MYCSGFYFAGLTSGDGAFAGWLEGNAVVTPEGGIADLLRVDNTRKDAVDKAAIVTISGDGKTASFDPATGFIDLPGGSKKFNVRYDRRSKLYWTLANYIPPAYKAAATPAAIRNTLALCSSRDLRSWQVRRIVLQHPDIKKHGFQYVDWEFDSNDIIFLSRTAYDDGLGGAHNFHDANLLTFHCIRHFRRK